MPNPPPPSESEPKPNPLNIEKALDDSWDDFEFELPDMGKPGKTEGGDAPADDIDLDKDKAEIKDAEAKAADIFEPPVETMSVKAIDEEVTELLSKIITCIKCGKKYKLSTLIGCPTPKCGKMSDEEKRLDALLREKDIKEDMKDMTKKELDEKIKDIEELEGKKFECPRCRDKFIFDSEGRKICPSCEIPIAKVKELDRLRAVKEAKFGGAKLDDEGGEDAGDTTKKKKKPESATEEKDKEEPTVGNTYEYEAMDTTGGEVKDTIDADSEEDAQQKIRAKGYFVTRLREIKKGKKKGKSSAGWWKETMPTWLGGSPKEKPTEESKSKDKNADEDEAKGDTTADGAGMEGDEEPPKKPKSKPKKVEVAEEIEGAEESGEPTDTRKAKTDKAWYEMDEEDVKGLGPGGMGDEEEYDADTGEIKKKKKTKEETDAVEAAETGDEEEDGGDEEKIKTPEWGKRAKAFGMNASWAIFLMAGFIFDYPLRIAEKGESFKFFDDTTDAIDEYLGVEWFKKMKKEHNK